MNSMTRAIIEAAARSPQMQSNPNARQTLGVLLNGTPQQRQQLYDNFAATTGIQPDGQAAGSARAYLSRMLGM